MTFLKPRIYKCIRSCTILIGISFPCLIMLTGCGKTSPDSEADASSLKFLSKSGFLLNTEVSVSIYDKQDEAVLEECFNLIKKYEAICSRTDQSSELYKLNNRTGPHDGEVFHISDELSALLHSGLYYSGLSKGAFDISVGPLTSLWDFTSLKPAVPAVSSIQAALPSVDYEYIHLSDNQLRFDNSGTRLDLGAIAKGYIADKVKEYLLAAGVGSAIINLGGNVLCVGSKPDGSSFHVGIQKPFADRNEIVGLLDIANKSVVSSGIYERFFEIDHVIYHHILNPETGYPYDNGLISVTIISDKSVDGDGLSTSCFALGLEKGLRLIESLPGTYALFITSDYVLHYSRGFKEAINFTLQ